MSRKRDERREKAFKMWRDSNCEMKLKDIATKLKTSDSQIRKWKSLDKWEEVLKGNVTLQKKKYKSNVTQNKKVRKQQQKTKPMPSEELTEMQRLFCIHYISCFNATMAALKAGYAKSGAHVEGHRLLKVPKIAAYIREVKKASTREVFVEITDVLNEYIKIAFADISDYVEYGNRKEIGEGDHSQSYSFVDVKNSDEVDGSVIAEVKQSREGISIKLYDKMKALEKLEQYFDLLPDQHKRRLEEEKTNINHKKYLLDERLVEMKEKESDLRMF